MTNPLLALREAGQSIWLDYLHRKILEDGELKRMIEDDGVAGMTSNPSIFEKAIGEGDAYDDRIQAALAKADLEPGALYEAVAIADIQAAADQFRPLYDRLEGADGYVSLEVSPYLAMDTAATIAEARRLWATVGRPNVMIKVPGTKAGCPAIRRLIGEGVNVNVTLLFGIDAYLAVADAHMSGLEALKAAGGDVRRVRGVASFFVSRIDTQIDKEIDRRIEAGDTHAADLKALRGKVAIANAKMAYQRYLEMLATPRWQALAEAGAAPQRLLWASTGAKDPTYSDVLYVEALIGPDTVNTVPPKTLEAFRDHGRVAPSLNAEPDEALSLLERARRLGLDLDGVTERLVVDGVHQFAAAFDSLLGAVAHKRTRFLGERLNRQSFALPGPLEAAAKAGLETAALEGWTRRMWSRDGSLWTGSDEAKWLGWLDVVQRETVDVAALGAFQAEIKAAGFTHALLLGMGGSSLAAEVLVTTFADEHFPEMLVLDSTDPAQIQRVQDRIDPATTLVVVSSKSGTTLEPNILQAHFLALMQGAVGEANASNHFVAITDPGSPLEALARREGFRRIFQGRPDIGGRYSAFSNFGLVPAVIAGLDAGAFLAAAAPMALACAASAPPAVNPGVRLGVVMGEAAKAGRDKVTILASKGLAPLGAWLEQLLAESTGKQGKGLIPIDAEPAGDPKAYGPDRLFVHLRLAGDEAADLDAAVKALEDDGHPVAHISVESTPLIGQEFFRWEVATAIAGAVLHIDPFDQPDVEASKNRTRALTDAIDKSGELPAEAPIMRSDGLALYADPRNAHALEQLAPSQTLEAYLGSHFQRAHEGDFIGLLAYLDRTEQHIATLQRVRAKLRDRRKTATVLGFGPRYLHSTGQAYKGGPNSGVFLQITAQPEHDIAIPGHRYSFGDVEAAQARGDFEVLAERGRRVLRLDLGRDVERGLTRFAEAVERALG